MNDNEYIKIQSEISQLAQHIVKVCAEQGFKISAAESCTGGLISAAVTAVSGSSAVTELNVCSYSNRIKEQTLGVSTSTLKQFTEYSTQCAEEMARGVMKLAGADFGVSTTGVAGPTGGTEEHPIGEVCISVCCKLRTHSKRYVFESKSGSGFTARDYIRVCAVRKALMLLDLMIMTEIKTP